MKYIVSFIAVAALTGYALAATPSGDQDAKVKAALTSQGFTQWKQAELDRGVWEIDDAIDSSGKQFDLRLDAKSLKTISKVAE